ncbi:hypothetical protein Goshw_026071 [Gossypium schwendimanii]|uniref:DUF7745 domain-containing protein n=1 Tax=Gossypium schwendimanii TaxID=34291 RepID=A0A7J9N5B4_GOSSC|nr:hypothetical protein [Gossypium schwendimanii]
MYPLEPNSALVHIRLLDRKLIMEKGFLDKVEDSVAILTWSDVIQSEKGDSLAKGYVSELWEFTCISVIQSSLQKLKEIWDQWNNEVRQLFYSSYGDLSYLLDIKVDNHLFRALAQFWNTTYGCFTFGRVDLVPTVEEYTLYCGVRRFKSTEPTLEL